MNINERKNLCLNLLVDFVSYSPGETLTSNYDFANFDSKITKTFEKYDEKKIFRPNLRFRHEDSQFVGPAHICAEEESGIQWAITVGIHTGIYLLLRKPFDSKKFQIIGLLEPIPSISPETELKSLEAKYLAAERNSPGESVELFASKFLSFRSKDFLVARGATRCM